MLLFSVISGMDKRSVARKRLQSLDQQQQHRQYSHVQSVPKHPLLVLSASRGKCQMQANLKYKTK